MLITNSCIPKSIKKVLFLVLDTIDERAQGQIFAFAWIFIIGHDDQEEKLEI